jgi:hypothetical protein
MVLCGVLPVQAATYYAAPSSGNTTNCSAAQNRSTPMSGLANTIQRCMSGGDMVVALTGRYYEQIHDIIPSGSSGAPSIVKSDVTRASVIATPNNQANYGSFFSFIIGDNTLRQWIVLDGFTIDSENTASGPMSIRSPDGVAAMSGTNNITVQNFEFLKARSLNQCSTGINLSGIFFGEVHHAHVVGNYFHDIGYDANPGAVNPTCTPPQHLYLDYGIYLHGWYALVENNEFARNSGYPIHNYTGGIASNYNVIRNNYFHDNGAGSLLCGIGLQFYNNIEANEGSAVSVGNYCNDSDQSQLYFNTIYNNKDACIAIGGVSPYASTNGIYQNNICYGNANDNIVVGSGSTNNTVNHNIVGGTNPGVE